MRLLSILYLDRIEKIIFTLPSLLVKKISIIFYKFIYASIIFSIVVGSMAKATGLDTNQISSTQFNIEALGPGHPVFQLIEEAIDEIFLNRSLRPTMCVLFRNYESISITLGITIRKSIEIFQSCQAEFNYPVVGVLAKIFTRKYFLIEDEDNLLPFDSWTNYNNETFLVINKQTSKDDLRKLLLHEIAISMDAKTNMLLSGFFFQEGQHSSHIDHSVVVMIPGPNGMTKEERELKQALDFSANASISMTFATLRAFAIEYIADHGTKAWDQANTHDQCTQRFIEIYKQISQINLVQLKDDKSMQGLLASYLEKNISLSENQILPIILDANLKIPRPTSDQSWWASIFSRQSSADVGMTFCQYMAYPRLSSKSVHSFYSLGPRPRIGGGWSSANMMKNSGDNGLKAPQTIQSILKNIPTAGIDLTPKELKLQQTDKNTNPNSKQMDYNSLLNRMKSSQ
jgi:hypothetical protein